MKYAARYPDTLELIADSNRGIYIPQHVAESCVLVAQPNASSMRLAAALENLRAGPDHPEYWEDWVWVLDNACIRVGRRRWALYQDGDCWAYAMNADGRKAIAAFAED